MLRRWMMYLQVDRTFLVLVFLFSYFLVISNRVGAGMISWYTVVPDGPIFQFIAALFIFSLVRFWLNRQALSQKPQLGWHHYGFICLIALVCYLLFSNGISLLIAIAFDTVALNFNADTLLQINLGYVADMVIYSGIYLAYTHSKQAEAYREQLSDYQQQLAQLKIQQLKAQLNPHFVFNSLNTLDELIATDPNHASQYLHDFAELYRLSLQNTDQQLVPMMQELQFAKRYFQLLQARLGPGYQLSIEANDVEHYVLPPFSLQLLLENALQHNQGSSEQPLVIRMYLSDQLVITHPMQRRLQAKNGHGIGLQNLAKQFLFLTGQGVTVEQTDDSFTVKLPLIKRVADA
ncbi:histidine kinase [Alkalimonas delamerensis]|uniref:Histidine kinase n=1 Tax=Alkalimonas delamerensis TaxID=265981 RepID=A0ABT9GRD6_9GAMM|nr:histidine kinase [Alkalimonas delamerensis]MDP4529528.1 histidine kinase [Alkalimonas delamerensis]